MTTTNMQLLNLMIGAMEQVAADIGCSPEIPPGKVADAFEIRNKISTLKTELEEYINEEN